MRPSKASLAACTPVHLGLEKRLCRRVQSVRRKEQLQRFLYDGTSAVQSRRTSNHFPTTRIYPRGLADGIRRMNMKIHNGLLIVVAVACSISAAPTFAKTARECTA